MAPDGFSHSLLVFNSQRMSCSAKPKVSWVHPAPEIEQAWQNLGSKTYRLGESGTLFVDLSQADLTEGSVSGVALDPVDGKISGTNYAKDVWPRRRSMTYIEQGGWLIC